MNPQEIEKLLGGYATDTLTEEERRTLFDAALGNQALFDALADEQALRELLDDPPSRAQLLTALREERVSPFGRFLAWLRQPSAIALAAAIAAGVVTIAVVIPRKSLEPPATVAIKQKPAPEPQASVLPNERRENDQRESAAAPKPAAAAPAGSQARTTGLRSTEKELDAMTRRDLRQARNIAAAAPPAQPAATTSAQAETAPPPPPVVATDSGPPATPAPAAAPAPPPPPPAPAAVSPAKSDFRAAEQARPQALAKVAGARDLYYSAQSSADTVTKDGVVSGAKTAKKAFGGFTMPRAASPPAPVIGGVRYSILRRNLDGSFTEVDPSTVFVPGDALRLRFETNQAGNLAVMERQVDGAWTLRIAARTQPGQPVYTPPESTIDVKAAGTFRFFVRFSRSLRNDARIEQPVSTGGLLRESAANSVYVVNPVPSTDPIVDFEVAINAR